MVSVGNGRPMTDCNHEEADTIIVVHIRHAIQDPNAEKKSEERKVGMVNKQL